MIIFVRQLSRQIKTSGQTSYITAEEFGNSRRLVAKLLEIFASRGENRSLEYHGWEGTRNEK